jgi:hypothetical protein
LRIFFDTEFIEDGHTIELLAIGAVREDGDLYYAESSEADHSRASEWVQANVLPHLTGGHQRTKAEIAAELIEWCGPEPEFWAYYADYDWVALCQLFGTMMDLPDGWPMYCRDLKQLLDDRRLELSQDDSLHNALGDARWVAATHAKVWATSRILTYPNRWAPKTLIERLSQQQGFAPDDFTRYEMQRLIDVLHLHRPTGNDGKHGMLHTPTCGCEDK